MKSIPLYELILADWTRYQGVDIAEPKWRDAPEEAIRLFKLTLPSGDFLSLCGYEEYNFFIEVVQGIYGNTERHITFMYVMGKRDNQVTSYRIALGDFGQYKKGDTTVRVFPVGKEYDGKPTLGWHKGVKEGVTNV